MDLSHMIRDLKAEREALSVAIECLESLARGGGKRRGRPPAWLQGISQRSAAGTRFAPSPGVSAHAPLVPKPGTEPVADRSRSSEASAA